jgi:outer membrane receptor protein involved in Fe transport
MKIVKLPAPGATRLLFALVTASNVGAQTQNPALPPPSRPAPAPAAADSSASQDEPKVLSPFVVTTSPNDIGYYAQNTLAGSLLNTNLGDLAASITVVTRQQLLDTASVDMNDVFLYEANTEGTGNFTAFAFDNRNSITDNTAGAPSTSNRVRGIGSVDRAHNYFYSIPQLSFDTYNTDSVEINRGPNSLLFGLGSPSGIVNQSSAQANLQRAAKEVSTQISTATGYRGFIRVNQPIVAGKLAVFVAGLYNSPGFTRKPAEDISRRGYFAASYAPGRNTTIRANYESYNNYSRRPNSVLPRDQITPWREAGSPTWNPLTSTATVNGVAQVVASANSVNGLRADPNANYPLLYFDNRTVPQLWMQRNLSTVSVNGPFNAGKTLATSSAFYPKNTSKYPLFQTLSTTDRSIYDWQNGPNLNAALASQYKADVYNVTVDQKLTNNLFVQVGWYREDFNWLRYQGSGALLTIDPNVVLLDGTPNPYLGRPFVEYLTGENFDSRIQNNNYRISLAYELDFTRKPGWRRWLGAHRLAVFGTKRELDTIARRYQQYVADAHSWVDSTRIITNSINVAGGTPDKRFYLGGGDGNIRNAPGLATHGNSDVPLRYATYNAATGAYTWINEPSQLRLELDTNTSRNQQTTNSLTYALQSHLVNDRVVVTTGIRRDENLARNSLPLVLVSTTGLLDPSNLNVFGPTQKVYGTTRTAGVVTKITKWMSLTYGQSGNFTPTIQQLDLFGRTLPIPTGKGKDYGVRFSLFGNKLVADLSWFKAGAYNARGTSATTYIQQMARFDHNDFYSWATKVAKAKLPANPPAADLTAATMAITGGTDNVTNPPAEANLSSTSTITAKGLEASLLFNPIPNWNIKWTAGQQRTTYSDIAPEFDSWEAARMPVWLSAKDASGNLFWNADRGTGQLEKDWYALNVTAGVKLAKALEGKRTQGQREWNSSVISTYRFISGPLKSFEFGGGVRFQDKAIIGYLGAAPDPDGIIRSLNPDKPVYDSPKPAFDAWASRSFHLPQWAGEKIRAKVQLNVRNLTEGGHIEPIAINPDGQVSTYRIIDPRQWFLSVTFDL